MYVGDYGNNRVQKFDSDGNFITKWGYLGSGNGQFDGPDGIAIDSSDNVYVGDTGNKRIQKFDSDGNFITTLSSEGSGDGQVLNLGDIAIDNSGKVYATDLRNSRILVFAPDTILPSNDKDNVGSAIRGNTIANKNATTVPSPSSPAGITDQV